MGHEDAVQELPGQEGSSGLSLPERDCLARNPGYDHGMNWKEYISTDPGICHGKPCFTGTRVMVSVVLDCLAADMTREAIIEEYPSLSNDAIRAALAYSADLAEERIVAA